MICPKSLLPFGSRCFSQYSARASHIGSEPIDIPPDVSISSNPPARFGRKNKFENGPTLLIKGSLGSIEMRIPSFMKLQLPVTTDQVSNGGSKALVECEDPQERDQRMMWGTIRSLLQNNISGVSEGHTNVVSFRGVGYRASKEGNILSLKVGFANEIKLQIPQGLVVTCQSPVRLLVQGIDKQSVGQFCASIRKWRPPEPYKGKGIFVNDEVVKRKEAKRK